MDFLQELFEKVFTTNHEVKEGRNPNTVFLAGFTDEHVELLTKRSLVFLEGFGREVFYLPLVRTPIEESISRCLGVNFRGSQTAVDRLARYLEENNAIVLIDRISEMHPRSMGTRYAKRLITQFDALSETSGTQRSGDLVFVDRMSFLEKIWPDVNAFVDTNVNLPDVLDDIVQDLFE